MTDGKIAVVTGASTGIGRAIACGLAERGWHVAFTFINSQDPAEETRAAVAGFGVDALAIRCDVGTRAEVDAFYEQVAEWKGAPDFLVNNAGIQTWAPLLDLEEEDWNRVIRTNLKGCFLNTQAAARRMRDAGKGGAIVNIGSGCNKLAFPQLVRRIPGLGRATRAVSVAWGRNGELHRPLLRACRARLRRVGGAGMGVRA